jgi:hypothetical protein
LESLLGGSSPLKHIGPSLQEIVQRFQRLSAVWKKTAVKVNHTKKILQLLDIPEGVGNFRFRHRDLPWWPLWSPKSCVQGISREGAAKTYFSKLMARPLVAKALKKPPDVGGVFACPENRLVSRPCMQTHLPAHLWCGPSFVERFVQR